MSNSITCGDIEKDIFGPFFGDLEGADKVYIYELYGKANRIGSFKPNNREQEMYSSIYTELQFKRDLLHPRNVLLGDMAHTTIMSIRLIIADKFFDKLEEADKVYMYNLYGKVSQNNHFEPSRRELMMVDFIQKELQAMKLSSAT